MKRLSTTNHLTEIEEIEYNIPTARIGKKCVDDSNFQPLSETLKKLNGQRNLTQEEVNLLYDFADGKDTGIKVPFERSSSNVDIAILSTDIQTKQKNIEGKVQEANEKAAREMARQQKINAITSTTISTEGKK